MNRPTIAIIGPGKVGSALAILARDAGYDIVAVGGRDEARVRAVASEVGNDVQALSVTAAAASSEFVILTVSDAAVQSVAEKIAQAASLASGAIVVHCSGALTSEVLSSVKTQPDISTGSFHPLQTFPNVESALESLPGSHSFIEGDARAVEVLERFGADIGTTCVPIETESKVLYHASAVMACNYLCSLIDAALTANEAAGIDRGVAVQALRPLIQATLDNIVSLGPEAALTGPIQRGDAQTVALHAQALSQVSPELQALYRALGSWTVSLASRSKEQGQAEIAALESALGEIDV